jgi:hypothetical protein
MILRDDYMDEEGLRLWLIWGQTDEDRAAIAALREDAQRAQRGETHTLCERPLADTVVRCRYPQAEAA